MIGLVAALWASAAAVFFPALLGYIGFGPDAFHGWQINSPGSVGVVESAIFNSFFFLLVWGVWTGFYIVFFGPLMALATWAVKLLKAPRGIADVLGWMVLSLLLLSLLIPADYTLELSKPYRAIQPTGWSLIIGLSLSNGLGGLVYYLKQRQLHGETDG